MFFNIVDDSNSGIPKKVLAIFCYNIGVPAIANLYESFRSFQDGYFPGCVRLVGGNPGSRESWRGYDGSPGFAFPQAPVHYK